MTGGDETPNKSFLFPEEPSDHHYPFALVVSRRSQNSQPKLPVWHGAPAKWIRWIPFKNF